MLIKIDKTCTASLPRQVCDQIRQQILTGKLKPGDRIPSSRMLAAQAHVARATVVAALEQLTVEGYLQAIPSSGTIVSLSLPSKLSGGRPATALPLTNFGQLMAATDELADAKKSPCEISFLPGQPDFAQAPVETLARFIWRTHRVSDGSLLDHPDERAGLQQLREAIAERVVSRRGINCHPRQVIITTGFQQSLDLILRVHVSEGELVAMEEPGFPQVRRTLSALQMRCLPVAVDGDGIDVNRLSDCRAKLLVVTPSHHFPTGTTLPLERRLQLVDWAKTADALILEDDFDSEFQYSGKPIPALQGLDTAHRVIYAATFSTLLYPSFGIGYYIVPESLIVPHTNARRLAADPVSPQLQASLAEFITSGQLLRHEKRMRDLYQKRRQLFLRLWRRYFGKNATVLGGAAGLHVMVRFETGLTSAEIVRRSLDHGIALFSTDACYAEAPAQAGYAEFALGFANVSADRMESGVKRLAEVIGRSR